MTTLVLTVVLSLWGLCTALAVSLCVVSGRADRAPQRGGLRLVSNR